MTTTLLWIVIATIFLPQLLGKVYKRDITRTTPKWVRLWGGPSTNTGNNYGGWLMRIVNSDSSSICGAVYYAPLLLIASGSCIHPYRYSLEGVSVEPTAWEQTDENIFGLIDTVYTPKEFKYTSHNMDVAVIRLQNPIKGKLTEFIKLCSKPIKVGMEMTAYAWGFDSPNLVMQSSDPRSGTVTVEDSKLCEKKFSKGFKLSSTAFCVTQPKDPTKCLYDGGSPLTVDNEYCGIVSHGPLCSDTSQPGLYTDVSKVAKFIQDVESKINSAIYLAFWRWLTAHSVLNASSMARPLLWIIFTVWLWPLQAWSKIYPRDITVRTPRWRRTWGGPNTNTGNNFGGWLLRIVNADSSSICGASYFSPLLVIASGNCIHPYRYSLEGTSVEPTATMVTDENVFGLIDIVYTPSDFRYLKQNMDVAVIRLKKPIKGKLTEFIKLCTKPINVGMTMTAYAWGFDSINVASLSAEPRNGSVTVESSKKCATKFGKDFRLPETSFCVTHPKEPSQCRYDGGCPLTYNNELCGIVSHGPLCADTSQPGIYTNVNKVAAFILEVEDKIKSGELTRGGTRRGGTLRGQTTKRRQRLK